MTGWQRGQNLDVLMLVSFGNEVNNLVRVRRPTPYPASGQIRFKGGSRGAKLLVEQLRDFPNGDNDDGPGSLEMAVRLAGELLKELYDLEPEVMYPVP